MKTIIIIALALAATFMLASCEQLGGLKFGACYEDVCVSVTMPRKSSTVIDSGK